MSTAAEELKEYFEKLASDKLSEKRNAPVILRIGNKSLMYKYTMARFKQLLNTIENDLDFAKEIVYVQFTAPEFRWKSRTTVSDLLNDWDAAKAVVESIRDKEKEKELMHKPFDELSELAWKELFGDL